MSTLISLQALAFYAREHFGEDGYPFEESIPSSFDLVFGVFIEETEQGGRDRVIALAAAAVRTRLCARAGFAPVTQPEVDRFVQHTLGYLEEQFEAIEDVFERGHLLQFYCF